jgi:hypothetical protein
MFVKTLTQLLDRIDLIKGVFELSVNREFKTVRMCISSVNRENFPVYSMCNIFSSKNFERELVIDMA